MKDHILQEIIKHDYLVCGQCRGVFDRDTKKKVWTLDKLHNLPVSHGICPDCAMKERAKFLSV